MKKRLICTFLCLMVLFAAPVYAANDSIAADPDSSSIGIRMTYISSCSANLGISSGGTATVTSSVTGVTGVTSVKIVATLQRYSGGSWSAVQSWTQTATGRFLSISKTKAVTSGYTYRVVSKVTAYNGSSSETTTVTSSQVSY